MIITYTLTKYQLKETTKGKGVIKYTLIDENDNERVVSATAMLGFRKRIKLIHPFFHREQPLIDALSEVEVNETFTVDFSDYNKLHPRDSLDAQTTKELRISHDADPFEGTEIYSFTSLINNKHRLFQLVFISVVVFIILVMAKHNLSV